MKLLLYIIGSWSGLSVLVVAGFGTFMTWVKKNRAGSTWCLLILLSTVSLHAATITLHWTPSINSTIGDPGTVNVYRITATCPQSTKTVHWLKLATNVSADGPYVDKAANTLYPHCYYVTAVIDGTESAPSNMTFVPVAPLNLSGAWVK